MRSTAPASTPTCAGSSSGPRVVTASRSSGRLIRRSGSGSPGIRGNDGILSMGSRESLSTSGAMRRSGSTLVLVGAHQTGLLDHVILDAFEQGTPIQPGLEVQVLVQGIHPEVIVMSSMPRRWGGAHVALLTHRVHTVHGVTAAFWNTGALAGDA